MIILVSNQYLLHSAKTYTPDEKLHVYINSRYLYYDRMGTLKYLPLDVINNP